MIGLGSETLLIIWQECISYQARVLEVVYGLWAEERKKWYTLFESQSI